MMQARQHKGGRLKETTSPEPDSRQVNGTAIIQFFAEVKFGVASKNCDNYGICQIDMTNYLWETPIAEPCNCHQKKHVIVTINCANIIEMAFPKSLIAEETVARYFKDLFFTIEESYELSGQIAQKYKLTEIPKIKTGRYKVQETEGFYIIRFDPESEDRN